MTVINNNKSSEESFINWRAAISTGLLAGLLFLLLEMIMVPLFLGGSPWAPPRLIGAILLGRDVLPPPATFNLAVFVTAMLLHFSLSVIYGIIVGFLTHRQSMTVALGIGLVFGFILYLVNFFLFTAEFPWFANARNWVSIFAHIVFGLAAAWLYKTLD